MSRITKMQYLRLLTNNIHPEPKSEKWIMGGKNREKNHFHNYGWALKKFDNKAFEEGFEKWKKLQNPDRPDDPRQLELSQDDIILITEALKDVVKMKLDYAKAHINEYKGGLSAYVTKDANRYLKLQNEIEDGIKDIK